MITHLEVFEISTPGDLAGFFRGKRPQLWGVGNCEILTRPLLGIVSARQINHDLAIKSDELMKQLAILRQVAFISGWHSQLEKQSLRLLLSHKASLVLCLAKALDRFKASGEVGERVGAGKALLLTHCSPRAKRISRDASVRRNELVIGLAAAVLVLSAPEGSASLNLARAALDAQKPVFTLDHHLNRKLLASSGSVATFESICAALR